MCFSPATKDDLRLHIATEAPSPAPNLQTSTTGKVVFETGWSLLFYKIVWASASPDNISIRIVSIGLKLLLQASWFIVAVTKVSLESFSGILYCKHIMVHTNINSKHSVCMYVLF